ncbi:protein SSUH2 homolog isoform X1 [Dasypus novemcinctus]|uniref:protein SSUH2 homolog isoform X1 n=1 Tax=Dasypus novemcinctus TaxID=9361 RepID=UPI00265D72E0|nr:protein SSUH2 homolog isoform X2 [Dasypus novemcinctus]
MEGSVAANWSTEAINASAAPTGPEGNRTAPPLQRNEALARVEVAVLGLIFFLALSGNACVLLALRVTRHKHSRLFFFMKHLSIADLVVALFQVLPQLVWDITFRFYGPDLLCRLVRYLQVVGMFASTYLLLLMSIDRCLAICQPLRLPSRRTDRLAVLATWLGCLVVSTPQLQIFALREVAHGGFDCWAVFIQPWGAKAYITWTTLLVYVVPVIVLTTCYSLICFKIWQNLRLKTAAAAAAAATEGLEGAAGSGGGGCEALAHVSSVKLISKAKIRTVKMTFIIVLAFIVCWTPFFVAQLWSVWDDNPPKEGVMDLSFEVESPLTPPAELLERLPSYDWLLHGGAQQIFFPPLSAPGRPQGPRSWSAFLEHRAPVVTEEVAREALLDFVNSKCCYGSAAAGDLVIRELKQQTLCRYRLETFSESRITEWTFEPFTNGSVDGPERGASPRLWDVKVQVPPMFQEDTRRFQVPHSSLVKECHKCHGRGRHKCRGCHGAGMVRCSSCSGAKRKAKRPRRCQVCAGSGRRRCSTCSGRGNKTCTTCKGERKLLHFIRLVIAWKNNSSEFVSEHQLNCPPELLAKAKGENLFKDENRTQVLCHRPSLELLSPAQVYPIVDFPLQEISLASQRAIARHSAALASGARILQQRQTIELIPLTEVHYWYHGQTSVYYIYGTDHKVYVVDYPERFCCGCTII